MQQRKHLIFLIVALFFAVGWLGTKESIAEVCPVINTCTIIDSNGTSSGWMRIVPDFDGNWPVPIDCAAVSGGKIYEWKYEMSPNFSTWGQGVTLIPKCCPDLAISLNADGSNSGGQILSPGVGDPTSGFGKGIFTDYTVRTASTAALTFVAFYTKEPTMQRGASWQFKVGKNTYYCPQIAGPDCALPGVLPVSSDSISKVGNFEIKVIRSRATGCGTDVQYRPLFPPGGPWLNTTISELVPGHSQVDCGTFDGNQACRECIQSYFSPFGCSSITVAGKPRSVPAGYDINGNGTVQTTNLWRDPDTGALYSEACPNVPPVWPCDNVYRDSTSGANPSPVVPQGTTGAKRCVSYP